MTTVQKHKSVGKGPGGTIDDREQTCNGREVGPTGNVQLPLDLITSLHGIVYDIDLDLLRPDAPILLALSGPKKFASKSLGPMMARDPVLRGAEVRFTGRNLHVIIWFDEPVAFRDDGERDRWAGIVKVVQAALPIDPDQPGITALTRPVESVNGKTGKPVSIIRHGTPVPVSDVLALHNRMARAPFRTVMGILMGSDRVSPCPICRAEGTTLKALDRQGRCYGSCGKVPLDMLYDTFLLPRAIATKGGERGVD